MEFKLVKIETFIPDEYVTKLREELNKISALSVDACYDFCMAVSKVIGSWRPLDGTTPFLGEIGEICIAVESKIEFTCRMELYQSAVEVIKKNHPYEKPVINIIPLLNDLVQIE